MIKLIQHLKMTKNLKNVLLVTVATSTLFTAVNCSKNEDEATAYMPTAQAFNNLEQAALNNLTQNFTINGVGASTTITTAKGSTITIPANAITLNGNPVTGNFNLKVIEIYDAGNMALTNKATMGNPGNGLLSMLVSGGELYVNATQNGQQLTLANNLTLKVPFTLTGGVEPGMTQFTGEVAANGDVNWNRNQNQVFTDGVNGLPGTVYSSVLSQFGWTNVDKFYSFAGPKTQILAGAPAGYDQTNSAIYLHYDGEGSGLARLDSFANGLFSEHYGQIPIGLACHIIFMTEDNGQWRYAIKPVTISAGATYNFTLAETTIGTSAQLTAAINGLP